MAREIPEVVRAAAGLAATVLDEARKLPETLPGLPVRLIGLAMQQAMKVQQHYAGFVARGDELFTGLRGEDEPGLATFDDDEPVSAPAGFRESAFDRAGDAEATSASVDLILEEEVTAAEEAPDTQEVLDEIAIDELVDQAPTLEETDPGTPAPPKKAAATRAPAAKKAPAKKAPAKKAPAKKSAARATAADTLDAEPTADVATTVDVLTPEGDVTAVEATVTDEGVAAPERDTATATDESGSPVATAPAPSGDDEPAASAQAPRNAPVDGYDSFTVAQLRGRLRGYTLGTVEELIAYEQATRARAPYLTMLRNRLEKLEEQAIESSPLAPRGA
jgi:hypothetical protein